MRFSTLFVSALASFCTAASATAIAPRTVTAQKLVDEINQITDLSEQLQPVAANIQPGNDQPLVVGFKQIIDTLLNDVSSMGALAPFPDEQAQKVCDAFSNVRL